MSPLQILLPNSTEAGRCQVKHQLLSINGNGEVIDGKAQIAVDGIAGGPAFLVYNQTLGVKYNDFCGITQGPDVIETLKVSHFKVNGTEYRIEIERQ